MAGVGALEPQLYQLRHSGPSVELALGLRQLTMVKLRGRWATDSSMSRYVKAARVGEQMQRLAAATQAAARSAPARLLALLARR